MRAPRRPRHARRELRDVGRTEREGRPTRSRRASLPGFQLGADRQPGLDLGQLLLGLRVLEVAANVLLLELLLALAVEVVGDGLGHVLAAVHPPLLAVSLEALEQLLGQADGELASGHTGLLPKYYQDGRAWDCWQAKSRTRAGRGRPGPARLWTTEPGRRRGHERREVDSWNRALARLRAAMWSTMGCGLSVPRRTPAFSRSAGVARQGAKMAGGSSVDSSGTQRRM